MTPALLAARLLPHLDRDAGIALLRGAISCNSVTGRESSMANYLETVLANTGMTKIERADFRPGRANIWAERKAGAAGKRLLFIGHTDTVHVEGWRERWAGTEREDPFGAAIVDGAIWGRGAGDLKAGISSAIAALNLIDRAGISLAGDIAFAFVGDEESGEEGTGVSAGIKDYVARIEAGMVARPDFVVYVEPTKLSVFPSQIGFFIADVTITGKSVYFGMPELGRDALKAGHSVLSALWAHSAEIEQRASHPMIGRGFLLVTSVESGGYIAVPETTKLSLIRKLLPGEDLDAAAKALEAEIRAAIKDPEISVDIAYPAGRDHPLGGTPAEISPDHPASRILSQSLAAALPGRGAIEGAPFWSEAPFFVNRLGIPAVYAAPGDISNCHTTEEHVVIEEYLAGIVGFASFIAAYLGTKD